MDERIQQTASTGATEAFETHRRLLMGLGYRMLGSRVEAEDAVQETWLRWRRADPTTVNDVRGYLAQITTRICLDQLKSARRTREIHVGPWLPEPLVNETDFATEPEAATERADDLTFAFMSTLERLSPSERAAFLLHDVFDMAFSDVARILNETETNCRQLAVRARARVRADCKRFTIAPEAGRALARAFFDAARSGDPSRLGELLAQDVVFVSDGGGRVIAATKPVHGRKGVVKLLVGSMRRFGHPFDVREARINGLPGFVLYANEIIVQTVAIDANADGKVAAIYVVRNPEKLHHLSRRP